MSIQQFPTSISLQYFIENQSHVIYITISVVLTVFLLYDLIINYCWIHKKNTLKVQLAKENLLIIPQKAKQDQEVQNIHENTGKVIKQIQFTKPEQQNDFFEGMKMIDRCMIEQIKENYGTGINFNDSKISTNNWNILNKWVLFSGLRSSLEFYSPILIAFLLIFEPQFTLKSFSSNATEQQMSNKTIVKTSVVVALLILSLLTFLVFNIVKAFICQDSSLQASENNQQIKKSTAAMIKKSFEKKKTNKRNDEGINFSSKKNLLSANIKTSNRILTKMETTDQSQQINCKSEVINIKKIKRRLKSHFYLAQLIYLVPLLVSIGLAISKIL